MRTTSKLYNSKASALQAGCKESDLTESDGVWYCVCSTTTKKEHKAVRTTKEFKTETKVNITKNKEENGNI